MESSLDQQAFSAAVSKMAKSLAASDHTAARTFLEGAIKGLRSLPDLSSSRNEIDWTAARLLRQLADLALEEANLDGAVRYGLDALAIRARLFRTQSKLALGDPGAVAHAYTKAGHALTLAGRQPEAISLAREALDLRRLHLSSAGPPHDWAEAVIACLQTPPATDPTLTAEVARVADLALADLYSTAPANEPRSDGRLTDFQCFQSLLRLAARDLTTALPPPPR